MLPLDQVFEIVKNQRRRYVLRYLNAVDGEVSLSDLAEQIAAWENDKEIRKITSSERKRVYVGLYQCHLPKMAGMDVITYNKARGIIGRGENADAVEPYLHVNEPTLESYWGKHYTGVWTLCAGLLLVAVLFQPFSGVPLVETAAALTTALTAVAVVIFHALI